MVMFKAKFKPAGAKPQAQQQRPSQPEAPKAPPVEKERGPQHPVKEPGPGKPAERAR